MLKHFCGSQQTVENSLKRWEYPTNCGKFLKEMGIPDHFTTASLETYTGQEATVRTRHGTIDCFKIGKRVCQGRILSPCLFNLYAKYIMQNARLD